MPDLVGFLVLFLVAGCAGAAESSLVALACAVVSCLLLMAALVLLVMVAGVNPFKSTSGHSVGSGLRCGSGFEGAGSS